jgi:recombinational DNA repair protein (RecF pathway)
MMDAGTMKDYLDDLIIKVGEMEQQFNALGEIIRQLQDQRDAYKALYESAFNELDRIRHSQ